MTFFKSLLDWLGFWEMPKIWPTSWFPPSSSIKQKVIIFIEIRCSSYRSHRHQHRHPRSSPLSPTLPMSYKVDACIMPWLMRLTATKYDSSCSSLSRSQEKPTLCTWKSTLELAWNMWWKIFDLPKLNVIFLSQIVHYVCVCIARTLVSIFTAQYFVSVNETEPKKSGKICKIRSRWIFLFAFVLFIFGFSRMSRSPHRTTHFVLHFQSHKYLNIEVKLVSPILTFLFLLTFVQI